MIDRDDKDLDRALREAFAGDGPDLDVGFHQRMRNWLVLERPRRRLSFRLIVLRSYWAAALLLSFLILRLLPWAPELVLGPFLIAFSTLAVVFLVPSLLVQRLDWPAVLLDALAESSDR